MISLALYKGSNSFMNMKAKVWVLIPLLFLNSFLCSQIKTIENTFFGCAPTTLNFYTVNNTSSGQAWDNGQGSIFVPPRDTFPIQFLNPGTFDVKVGSLKQTITIYSNLSFNFASDSPKTGCTPFRFNLRDVTNYPTGINPVSHYWNYENGGIKTGNPIQDVIYSYYYEHCFVIMNVVVNPPSCNGNIQIPQFFSMLETPRAKIDIPVHSSCHVPFLLDFGNKSGDSLKTDLNFLWTWQKPTAGTSTDSIPSSLNYTTNVRDMIRLEVTNKYGCKAKDSIFIIVDTPTLDFKTPNKTCVNDTLTVIISDPDANLYNYSFISSTYYLVKIDGDTAYRFLANRRPTGSYPLKLTKTLKSDANCYSSLVKQIILVNDAPKVILKESYPCRAPIVDTILVNNVTSLVDSIIYFVGYYDKYNVTVKDSFYGGEIDVFRKLPKDSILIYSIRNYPDIDSYYRKGPLLEYHVVAFVNKETQCYLHDTILSIKNSLFRASLMDYQSNACIGQKDSFRVYSYADHVIDSVYWFFGDNTMAVTKKDTTMTHQYSLPGVYRAYAIVKNSKGCTDTTNPVFVRRGDSILPQISVSKYSTCTFDTVNVSLTNHSAFDHWFFVSDSFKSFNCPNQISYSWTNFYQVGKQYVYVIADKFGCRTKSKDSIFINGPKFRLDYDFKCSRKDSILYFLRDTFMLQGTTLKWDFGDGTVNTLDNNQQWHKFYGDSIDYSVSVSTIGSTCAYSDTAIAKIRKVRAVFMDTLFCKETNPDYPLNKTPYRLNPKLSRNAGYLCGYTYTWSLSSISSPGNPSKKFPPYTSDNAIWAHIPLDTMNLSLIARDINGCSDTMTKQVIVSDNNADFTLISSSVCPPNAKLTLISHAKSPFGIIDTAWEIIPYIGNSLGTAIFRDTAQRTSYTVSTASADSFLIKLTIVDSAYCNTKENYKVFKFYIDTSKLIVPKKICENTSHQIWNNINDPALFEYRWYINNIPISDSTASLAYKFSVLGRQYIRLEKRHKVLGCVKTFIDSTIVLPKPRLSVTNTFDTVRNRCFPAIATLRYYDSAFISNLNFYFEHKSVRRSLNPTSITLHQGENIIYSVFSTDYGCRDSFVNFDTVIRPYADLISDKSIICKGDKIQFKMTNKTDVDTVHWVFGDGYQDYGVKDSIEHTYHTANSSSDTMTLSYIIYGANKSCPNSQNIKISVLEALSMHHLNDNKDTALCFSTIQLHNTSKRADYYKWDFGNGFVDTTSQSNFKYQYQYPGVYRTKLYAYRKPLGCVDSSIRSITLYSKPELSLKKDTICYGKDFNIYYKDTVSPVKVSIYPDIFGKNPHIASPIISRMVGGSSALFTLVSESEHGCKDTISTQPYFFIIHPDSIKNFDTIIEAGKRVQLPIVYNPNYRYTWTPELRNPSCVNCSQPELQFIYPTYYHVKIVDSKGCFTDTALFFIDIYPDIKVEVPTAFSPNGDGNNDILYPRGFGVKKLLDFKIFNRLGQVVFATSNLDFGWDGNYKGIPQNSDTYYYTYEAESFIPKKIVSGEGNFLLLR